MSLKKTDTLQMDQDGEIWGILKPLCQGLSSNYLKKQEILIGRNPECTIVVNDKRLSGKHCKIQKKQDRIVITDLSTNGTFINDNDKRIGKGQQIQIKMDTEIWILSPRKVNPTETLGFKLELVFLNKREQKKKKEEQAEKQMQRIKVKKEEEAKKEEEPKKQQKKGKDLANSIKDQITCAFCFDIMSIPVSVQPCNHRFCGGCLTELVNNKKQACIHCRKQITTAVRDSGFNSIIADYLKSNPQQKRDPKEQEQLAKKNIFGYDPVDVYAIIHGKKAPKMKVKPSSPPQRGISRRGKNRLVRASSDLSASDDDIATKCRECVVARNGFQCISTQIHVGCHSCGKLIALRDDPKLNQSCVLCTTHYCNLYFPPCSKSGVKLYLVQNRRQTCKIDPELLRAIRNYLLGKKQTSKNVFDYILALMQKGKFSYIFDRKIMRVPPMVTKEVKLSPESSVCDLCWKDLWFQMVFTYRMQITAMMPSAVKDRPVCYWGVNCRTMDHNGNHSRKYNHLVYQTRF